MQEQTHISKRGSSARISDFVLEALTSYVIRHEEWCVPTKDPAYWRGLIVDATPVYMTNTLGRLAEDLRVVKVKTRELPDVLKLRPSPCRMTGNDAERRSSHIAPEVSQSKICSPVVHFVPSIGYLEERIPMVSRDQIAPLVWLRDEVRRIMGELQREDVRAWVSTNVESEFQRTVGGLTDRLLHQLRSSPLVLRREDVVGVVSASLRQVGGAPLSKERESLVLEQAKLRLAQRSRAEVSSVFRDLRLPRR